MVGAVALSMPTPAGGPRSELPQAGSVGGDQIVRGSLWTLHVRALCNNATAVLPAGVRIREAWYRLPVSERINGKLDGDLGSGWTQEGLQSENLFHRAVRSAHGGQPR